MTTPNLKNVWMIAGALAATWALAGCASKPTAPAQTKSVPQKSMPSANPAPLPQAAVAEIRPEHPPGWSPWQVEAFARYVRIQGALPEAKGALAFLADETALKAGTIRLTRAQADAALAELARITGKKAGSTMRVEVASGNPASMRIGVPHLVNGKEAGSVEAMGTTFNQPSDISVVLDFCPQVMEDGLIQVSADVSVTRFTGFVEYTGDVTPSNGEKLKVPAGFYQPTFSTSSAKIEARMASGEVVVVRADRELSGEELKRAQAEGKSTDESLLVFLTVAKHLPTASERALDERMRAAAAATKQAAK